MRLLAILCVAVVAARADVAPECFVTQFEDVDNAVAKCRDIVLNSLTVPAGETLSLPLLDNTTLTFRGYISFEYYAWDGPLVVINATNALIQGPGAIFDGKGREYWDGQGEWSATPKPKFFILTLFNSVMKDIYVLNSPRHVAGLRDSDNVEFSGWIINDLEGATDVVPKNQTGHNTDGFNFSNVTNVVLRDAQVYNQDDCVAISHGANIFVEDLFCSGSHGLGISAAATPNYTLNTVFNVTFQNCVLEKGVHAIHVRNHVDGGLGLIQNITYRNITFSGPNVAGIKFQQNFKNLPPGPDYPPDPVGNVPFKHILLENIQGTVLDGAVPVDIKCADGACLDWEFKNVHVTGTTNNSCNFQPQDFQC